MDSLTIDGVALDALGFKITQCSGWKDAPERSWPSAPRPGRIGAVLTQAAPDILGRSMRVEGVVRGASASAMRTAMDQVKERLSRGQLQVIYGDESTRYLTAVLERFEVEGRGAAFTRRFLLARFGLFAPDPRFYSTSQTSETGITTTPRDLQLGTAISEPVLTVTGAATNPVLTYKDRLGSTVQSMTFGALSLGAGETLVVDVAARTIVVSDPTARNGMDELTAGDFIELDPGDADLWGSPPDWPTIECSSGTLVATYRKAYL